MIIKTEFSYDLNRLIDETNKLLPLMLNPLNPDYNQLGLTARKGIPFENQPFDAVGRMPKGCHEKDFSTIIQSIHGTYLEQIINSFSCPLGRVRIHRLPPKTCTSFHLDSGVRYHLAIHTNSQSLIACKSFPTIKNEFSDKGLFFHLPSNGFLYKMDATQIHMAMNGGLEDRIHLVFCTQKEDLDLQKYL